MFDDPERTWYDIDPANGRVFDRMDQSRRAYRWWFNALHSLDFPWLYRQRPLWDVLVVLLSLAGLTASVTGAVIGWRWLRARLPSRTLQNRRWGQNGSRHPNAGPQGPKPGP